MTRKIKFRAWNEEYKQLIYFGLDDIDGGLISIEYENDFKMIDIDNCIIMQFTGLLDKHGKMIFEGDILKYGNTIGYMHFTDCGFHLENKKKAYIIHLSTVVILEVIGNIYEDKHLLEKQ